MSNMTPGEEVKEGLAYNENGVFQHTDGEKDIIDALKASLDDAQGPQTEAPEKKSSVESTDDPQSYHSGHAVPPSLNLSPSEYALQQAIQLSMQDAKELMQKLIDSKWDRLLSGEQTEENKGKSPDTGDMKDAAALPNLEDMIKDLCLNMYSELPLLYDPKGDTYVYIDPPSRQPEQDDNSYFRYVERYKTPLLLRKQTLLSSGSPVFKEMFGPTSQYRIIRRRGLVGKLPDNVKYVIDLTPPAEGDDAVYLMTELCCVDGVLQWFLATQRWGVSKSLIGGQDEYVPSSGHQRIDKAMDNLDGRTSASPSSYGCATEHNSSDTKGIGQLGQESKAGFTISNGVLVPLPLEYSPIRHRSAIERVLCALQGLDPHLDSAPKVWTTFAVAKTFEISSSLLTDYIVRWLRATPNSYFLEVMPEVVLKMADGLKCYDLCRDVFAILVGEEALATAHRRSNKGFGSQKSICGRKKYDCLEVYQTRIEYASKAFIERITGQFYALVDAKMSWIEELPEFQKLDLNGPLSAYAGEKLLAVRSKLKAYLRGIIFENLCANHEYMWTSDEGRPGGEDLYPRVSWARIWLALPPYERIFTRSFWRQLNLCSVISGTSNIHMDNDWDAFLAMGSVSDAERALCKDKPTEYMFGFDLADMIADLNDSYVADHRQTNGAPTKQGNDRQNVVKASPLHPQSIKSNDQASTTKSGYSHETGTHCQIINGRPAHEHALTEKPISVKVQTESQSISESLEIDCWTFDELPASTPITTTRNTGNPDVGKESADGHFFDLYQFFAQAKDHLADVACLMLGSPDASMRAQTLELGITNTLVCLSDSEWKFLPMWAGGNDDGSGGVFNDDVPFSYEGFATAGPQVRITSGSSTSTSDSSDFAVVRSHPASSFLHASVENHDGRSSTLEQGQVVSVASKSSDDIYSLDGFDIIADNRTAAKCSEDDGFTLILEKLFGEDYAIVKASDQDKMSDSVGTIVTRSQLVPGEEEETHKAIADMEAQEQCDAAADKNNIKVIKGEETYDDLFDSFNEEDSEEGDEFKELVGGSSEAQDDDPTVQ